jgi:hypothetical protein
LFDILDGFVIDAKNLIVDGMLVLAIVFVGWTWWRTKALTTTFGALLFAAVVLYGVNHFEDLSAVVQKDVDERRQAPVTTEVDGRSGPR